MNLTTVRRVLISAFVLAVMVSLIGCGGDKKDAPVSTNTPAKSIATQEETIQSIFAKAKQTPGMTYDSVVTMKEMTLNSRVWAERGKVKMEQTVQGRKSVMYFDGEDMYQYDPASNLAMKFSTKGMEGKGPRKPDAVDYTEHMVPDSMKVIENVVYDGVKCRVISYTMKGSDGTVKMWVREDYGLPMRTEMTTKDGEKIVTENKNMKIGALPPETFNLPAGVQIKDMSEMMKRLPQKP